MRNWWGKFLENLNFLKRFFEFFFNIYVCVCVCVGWAEIDAPKLTLLGGGPDWANLLGWVGTGQAHPKLNSLPNVNNSSCSPYSQNDCRK